VGYLLTLFYSHCLQKDARILGVTLLHNNAPIWVLHRPIITVQVRVRRGSTNLTYRTALAKDKASRCNSNQQQQQQQQQWK
jgi:hypothetical protein